MDERARVLVATLAGAAVGGVVGCLYLTEAGRRFRQEIGPFFDSVTAEIQSWRDTVDRARQATEEGRRALDELFGQAGSRWAPDESVVGGG